MSRYFSYRLHHNNDAGSHREEWLIISRGQQPLSPLELEQHLEDVIPRELPPDYLLIIDCETEVSRIVRDESQLSALKEAVRRGGALIKARVLVGIDSSGQVASAHILSGIWEAAEQVLKNNSAKLWAVGAQTIAEKRSVVKIAPPGCVFVKPSERLSGIFILAGDLAHSEPEIRFIGFALLSRLGKSLTGCSVIYIDTMAVYQLVREMCAIFGAINIGASLPAIESFHSYKGLKSLKPERANKALCVISASTSGGLARDVQEKIGLPKKDIVTLLDIVDDRDESQVLVDCRAFSAPEVLATADMEGNSSARAKVELAGEFFASPAKPPRQFLLRDKHCVSQLRQTLEVLTGSGLFALHAQHAPTTLRDVSVDIDALKNHSLFFPWFQEELAWSAPANVKWIVHASDQTSLRMAEIAAEYLRDKTVDPIELVPAHTLSEPRVPLMASQAVLIVAAIVRRGSTLLEVSRDLRAAAPRSPRAYITGLNIFESTARYESLKGNLQYASSMRRYIYVAWKTLAIGHEGDLSSWHQEQLLCRRIQNGTQASIALEAFAAQRFDAINGRAQRSSDAPLFASLTGQRLKLRPGFVFWSHQYNADIATQSDVFLSVSAVLQAVRERKDQDGDGAMRSTIHEQVLISPECFARYNDGVIQASLLRAAYPSELDYSGSKELSADMLRILIKALKSHCAERGEAALEFGLAFCTGRLKLTTEDSAMLRRECEQIAGLPEVVSALFKLEVPRL